MKRIHAVAEGHGDFEAFPALLYRILDHLGRLGSWLVNKPVARLPRSVLVDESVPSPRRPPAVPGFDKAIGLARASRSDALVVLVDSDDDCPATFGPAGTARICARLPGVAMAVREFETWLLLTFSAAELQKHRIGVAERKRDAKGALRRLVPGYAPTTHQAGLVRRIDVGALRQRSASFDKLVRDVDSITK
jgi:hypothetical protein